MNRELLAARSELGSNALAVLVAHLRGITNVVPPRACEALQRVPIWLGLNDGHAPCAEYHPSRDWLAEHGYNPDKARCVEVGNARRFIDWSPKQPMMILHELAHAYHDQVLGFENERIRAAYERARKSGRYDAVARNNGRTERAYALTDDHEYFAEISEAYFGTNDYYPFTRAELKRHDPEMFEILEEVWKVKEVYQVNRKVSSFPTREDLSTPEAAYATLTRFCALGDKGFWRRLSVPSLAAQLPVESGTNPVPAKTAAAWLNTEIVEVRIHDSREALVIGRVASESGTEFDLRWLERWRIAG